MKKYLKYFLLIAIIAFIVPQITLAMWWNPFSWGFWNSLFHKQTPTTQVVCTKEAKLCPDGLTTVGRQGPKCEFTPCPVKYSCHTNSDCISQCTNGCVNNSWAQKNIDNSECLRAWSCSCINNVCYTDGNHPKNIVGNDRDSHGCIGSAGYSWCEVKNKCLRTFEEKCEADTTVNWKTYTNTTYGFSIKYPKELNISDEKTVTDSIFSVIWNSSKTGFENASGMRISIYQRNGKTPNEWIIPNYSFVKNISVDGINGIIAHAIVVMNGDFNATVFQKGNYIYLIQTSSDLSDASKDPIDLLEQITSTFKFIPK